MATITKHYVVDLANNDTYIQVPAVQYETDNVRFIEFEFLINGAPFYIDSTYQAALKGTKPDGTRVEIAASVVAGIVKVNITKQMSACAGIGVYQILIIKTAANSDDNVQIASFPFYINVVEASYGSVISSKDEITLLADVIKEVNDKVDDAKKAADDTEATYNKVKQSETKVIQYEAQTKGYMEATEKDVKDASALLKELNNHVSSIQNSVTQAQNFAASAETSSQNAATSESNAATSASNAATSASNAKTSEDNAKAYATAAETAANSVVDTTNPGSAAYMLISQMEGYVSSAEASANSASESKDAAKSSSDKAWGYANSAMTYSENIYYKDVSTGHETGYLVDVIKYKNQIYDESTDSGYLKDAQNCVKTCVASATASEDAERYCNMIYYNNEETGEETGYLVDVIGYKNQVYDEEKDTGYLKDAQGYVSDCEEIYNNICGEEDSIKSDFEDLENKVTLYTGSVDTLNATVETLQSNVSTMSEDITSLKTNAVTVDKKYTFSFSETPMTLIEAIEYVYNNGGGGGGGETSYITNNTLCEFIDSLNEQYDESDPFFSYPYGVSKNFNNLLIENFNKFVKSYNDSVSDWYEIYYPDTNPWSTEGNISTYTNDDGTHWVMDDESYMMITQEMQSRCPFKIPSSDSGDDSGGGGEESHEGQWYCETCYDWHNDGEICPNSTGDTPTDSEATYYCEECGSYYSADQLVNSDPDGNYYCDNGHMLSVVYPEEP